VSGPLTGYRVIELAGIGPGPYAGQLLADMGAEVITVQRPGSAAVPGADGRNVNLRGKKSIVVDLRKSEAAEVILRLVETADVLLEGNRPQVAERLGVGPEDCHKRNPKLVYGRMTGWGQTGPWADMAGHDINYISVTGALHAMGNADRPPPPPLNLVGDYGGGSLFLVNGILAALLMAEKTGKGDVIDAAIVDGVNSMMAIVHSMDAAGMWSPKRGQNMLSGAAPFYRCYECTDGGYMAVGCIEAKFFAEMIKLLNISPDTIENHFNVSRWADQTKILKAAFLTRSRDEWAEIFDGTDACVTPVLDYKEAAEHKHITARKGLRNVDGLVQPSHAPLFEMHSNSVDEKMKDKGADTIDILKQGGFSKIELDKLLNADVIESL